MSAANNECITVVVRCRPMNRKEHDENRKSIIEVDPENRQVGIRNPDLANEPPKYFTFDATYDEKTQQKFFYEESCFNVIESTLEGFNSTIFAYGQTGCGKSFTMQGPSTTDENMRGVIPNSFSHIFQFVKTTKNIEFLIRCSYLELYNEEIRDLLIDPKVAVKCELKEDPNKGVYVKGLTDVVVESPEDLHKMLDKGLTNRTTAATLMNSESSRSHSIFTIIVEMSTKDEMTGKDLLRVGKLNLVDLAGSERAKKTGATDKTLKEGIRINLSLSVLGNVISALAEGGKFIPYRDSKLTRLLQDSLGGNTKTMMVAAISPADYNYDETLSTLRYANRAKNIKNKPKINEDPKDAMIREFKAEIERLRKMLADQAGAAALLAQLQINVPGMENGNIPQSTTPTQYHSQQQPPVQSHQQQQQQHHAPLEMIEEGRSENNSPQKKSQPVKEIDAETSYDMDFTNDVTATPTDSLSSMNPPDAFVGTISPSKEKPPSEQQQNRTGEMITTPRDDYEQQIRGELQNRLHQLEHMLVNSEEVTLTSSSPQKDGVISSTPASGKLGPSSSGKNSTRDPLTSSSVVVPPLPLKTPEQIAEEEKQIQEYKERKKLAKKRREEKQQRELQKVLEEKKQIAEELEELKQNLISGDKGISSTSRPSTHRPTSSAVSGTNNVTSNPEDEFDDYATKKLQKLKKRYEKKLLAAKEELEDLRDDFYYQRKQLMDAALEQEKDCKLYEIICRSFLGDRELKKIVDKCKYDDEKDEWIVPFIKRKHVDVDKFTSVGSSLNEMNYHSPASISPMNQTNGNAHIGGSSSSFFPDIHNPNTNNLMIPNNNPGKTSIEQKFSSLQTNSWAINAPMEDEENVVNNNRRPASQSRRARSSRGDSRNRESHEPNTDYANNGYTETPDSRGKSPLVPLLTLPGSLVSASSLISPKVTGSGNYVKNPSTNTSARRDDYYGNASYNSQTSNNGTSLPGIGFSTGENDGRAKSRAGTKSKNKLPKGAPSSTSASYESSTGSGNGNKMPAINQQQQKYVHNANTNSYNQATDYSNVDEMGTGETAGPLKDWGFANNDSIISESTAPVSDRDSINMNYHQNNENYAYPNNGNYTYLPQDGKKSSHGKKKKATKSSMDSSANYFPPIETNKHVTPRGGGGLSLPPI